MPSPSSCWPCARFCRFSLLQVSVCLQFIVWVTLLGYGRSAAAAADLQEARWHSVPDLALGMRTWWSRHEWRSMKSVSGGEALAPRGMSGKQGTDFLGDYNPSPNVDTGIASPLPSASKMIETKDGNRRKLLQDYSPMANTKQSVQDDAN